MNSHDPPNSGRVDAVREAVPPQLHFIDDHDFGDRRVKWKSSLAESEVDYSDSDDDFRYQKHKHKKKHRKEKHGKKKSKHTEHREKHKPRAGKATKSKKQKRRSKFADDDDDDFTAQYDRQTSNSSRRERESGSKRKRHSEPTLRQCLGPACVKVARTSSKYCSDECGLKLAETRIKRWLPERFSISRWDVEPVASQQDQAQLEKIATEKEQIRVRLENLAERRRELDELIERASKQRVTDEPNDEDDSQIYCVVCGHEVNSSRALKHIERCFTKAESRTMFGSFEKARADAQGVFCDEYNPKLRTYCKRLKVLCPEHSHKLDKEDRDRLDNASCGFPLTFRSAKAEDADSSRLFNTLHAENFNIKLPESVSDDVQFCSEPKASCSRHFMWDRLRKAQIDMERVRLWMRIEELHEVERRVNSQLIQRRNLLGVLLHTTIDHCALAASQSLKTEASNDGEVKASQPMAICSS